MATHPARKFFRRCACCAEPATTSTTPVDRRSVVRGGLAALGLGTGLAGVGDVTSALSQGANAATQANPRRIDVHHHFSPPQWKEFVKGRELLQPANVNWTPAKSIEDMDKGAVAAAVISVTNPGLWFGDREMTRRIARECNEYGAKLVQQYPARFGLFAALPMPDIDATLQEIEYAFDTLKADGAHFMTSFGDTWLGNPAHEPVMAELHRRKTVVHVHPTAANCCKNLIPGMSPGVMEYGTDTTRAMMSVMWSGQAARYPDIRFIWSHAGGTAPFLAGRIDRGSRNLKDKMPQGAMHEMKRFYYDTAGAANPGAIASLLKLVASDHIMFGTDFPPGGTSAQVAKALAELGLSLTEADMRNIDRENAIRLLPRLQAS
jgi:predicted TIM-barrel fold metal-dependent hydrolase